MLMVISPAKSLDYETPPQIATHTQPDYLKQSKQLITRLKKLKPAQVSTLMDISDNLAALNVARYGEWKPPFTPDNAKQAVLAFNGDVYDGLGANDFTETEFTYVQGRLRILSGLYGVLRPLDLMQPYRLEMGTRLETAKAKDLYGFWDGTVTRALNELLKAQETPVLVNLASEEYFKVVQPKAVKARIVHPVFEDWKGGRYKIISFFAKKARGMMVRYAVKEQVADVE
ncbi:MAG TPA: peroxide stress protein YaaA, partial [Burkholderiales bacterium]|nr:peroxide stress protein YaaA [Burkholderiales bacterium]